MLRALAFGLALPALTLAQWRPAPAFPLPQSAFAITQRAQAHLPFTVAGERGAVFGQQNGSFEIWNFPNKIASHFRIAAELAGYPIPIDVNEYASTIDVHPDRTTITYSHAAFTIRQHMFAPRANAAAGAVVFFEISSVRPLALTIAFTPDMLRMWPAPNFNRPSAEWVPSGGSGYYVLHTDNEAFSGFLGMPGATPGVLAPYQERPRTYPLELKLAFDPKTQSKQFFPLLIAPSAKELTDLAAAWPALYRETAAYYEHFFDRRLTAATPDPQLDLALRWAELAIDQSQVSFHGETGMVAGYYSSADSARPGFGWFFGRDTLFSLYAVHGYGDFALSRRALEFLLNRQRSDGKIMHEFSQAADLVDWKATPYFYASADATPLMVMTMHDYVRASGDLEFLRRHWPAIQLAYAFTRAHDSDGDGIYENTEGTGWVESWPNAMPHQEVYLAALDRQSCTALSEMAAWMKDAALAKSALAQAEAIGVKLSSEYFDPARKFYAFSRNADGTTDRAATVFPAVAWWNGSFALPAAENMFTRWASHEFSTDWGMRDLSANETFYDPISYHQGSVWPLYTGWTALAEYRAGRPLSGYSHLMQNALQTFTQDPGAVTELLSGDYFQPFGRSSSHQLWSSAMVITPAVRGLFGVEVNAPVHALSVHPQLPASWESAQLRNVAVGDLRFDVLLRRDRGKLIVEASSPEPQMLCLNSETRCETSRVHTAEVSVPAVEIELPHALPAAGLPTLQPKVLSESETARSVVFELEGQGSGTLDTILRVNRENVKAEGAEIVGGKLRIRFPDGEGYRTRRVTFTW